MSLSTHVLDTGTGEPASGVPVRLERAHDHGWLRIAEGVTDDDGRLRDFVPAEQWHAATYRLTFDTAARSAFFPEVSIVFFVAEPSRHHHIPLLLSPYGYSTYRGS
ncbi:MAG TPA: hydroxyisourate hydrolase [Micromonosporaceae bacterium]|jgi:5-hydroxyisourate hydrolase